MSYLIEVTDPTLTEKVVTYGIPLLIWFSLTMTIHLSCFGFMKDNDT